MKKFMITATILLSISSILFAIAYGFMHGSLLLTLLITSGTTLYHFAMRLLVGSVLDHRLHCNIDIYRSRFLIGNTERKLYRLLHVKTWKKHIPTYDPEQFDITRHNWKEIACASAQAETIHLTIAILSLLPILASIWLGDVWVFAITSILASLFDLSLAVVQRYNRDRIYRILDHEGRAH